MRFISRRSTLAILATAALAPTSAWAGGFSATRFGGEHGHPATDDPTAVYYNPAGLAYGHGTRILVEGLFVYRTVDYDRDPGDVDDPGATPADIAANSGHGSLGNFIVSPFIGVASDLGVKGLGVGLGIYAPFGGQTSWDKNSAFDGNTTYPGAVDGPARWSSIEGEQRSIYFSLGGGWHTPNRVFGVGAAFNAIKSNLSLVRARNIDGTDNELNSQGGLQEGRSLLELSDLTFSAALGVMYQPSDQLRIGLSYQAQPNFGEMSLDGTLTNKFGATTPSDLSVQMRQQLPDSVRAGATWKANDKLELHFAADFQRWSVFKDQCLVQVVDDDPSKSKCVFKPAGTNRPGTRGAVDGDNGGANVLVNIPRDWNNTFSVRAGGEYKLNDKLELNGGLLFDSNAVPDETLEPALIDTNKLIAQLGTRYGISDKLMLSGTLGYVAYFSRTTSPRPMEFDPPRENRNPDMAGTFKSMVAYLLVGVSVQM